MIKAKWLYSELPVSLNHLARLMKARHYSEESGKGFLLTVASSEKLSGKYVEKMVQNTVVENPFGEISEVKTVIYYTCNFNWVVGSNFLLILNPPRSLRKFINQLHSLTGFGLVMSEISVSPDEWLKNLENTATSIKVLQMSAYGIRTSQHSTAKVIVKGSSDIKESFSSLVAERRYLVDSLSFEAVFDSLLVNGELIKNGNCKIKTANSNFVLELLRSSLEFVLNKETI